MKRILTILMLVALSSNAFSQNKTLADTFLAKAVESYELANYSEVLYLLSKAKEYYADNNNLDVLYLESKTMFVQDQTDPKTRAKINQYITLAPQDSEKAQEIAQLLVEIELGDFQEQQARGPLEKVGALGDNLSTSTVKKNATAEELMQASGSKKKRSKKETKAAKEAVDPTAPSPKKVRKPEPTASVPEIKKPAVIAPKSTTSTQTTQQKTSSNSAQVASGSNNEKLYFMPSRDDTTITANVTTSSSGGITPATTKLATKPNVPVEEPEVLLISSDEVPFKYVENSPIISGCDSTFSETSRKECVSLNINAHVSGNFDSKVGQGLGLSGIQRIYVTFVIDKNGQLTNIKAQGPHPKLEQEAARVLRTLPTFKPGRQDGKPIDVVYTLPIAVGL